VPVSPSSDAQLLCSELAVLNDPEVTAACGGAATMATNDLLLGILGALKADYPALDSFQPCPSSSAASSAGTDEFTSNDGDSSSPKNETGIVRVMFNCRKEESKSACEARIRVIPEDSFSIVYYLAIPHAYSLAVNSSYVDDLEGIEDDPPRYMVNAVDSSPMRRRLQAQAIPYGVNMVKAPSVWSKYNTKGKGVRVCGKSHQSKK
jgi:hypothetical protein